MEYLENFYEWERNFKADAFLKWHSEMTDIPIITIAVYLAIIFGVPKILSKPLPLKKVFAVWNLGLSIFSICGASRVVPFLYEAFQKTDSSTPSARHRRSGTVLDLWVYG